MNLRILAAAVVFSATAFSAEPPREPRELIPPPFDAYFARRVAELSTDEWRRDVTPENWPAKQKTMRAQLQRMLGLDPWPERGELRPVVTGTVQGDGFVVEKLHFQSLPGVYVTGDFYRPQNADAPLPTILYVCGHSNVVENGISMGNKTGYQHHGVWFARHGYNCLVIDTIQLGEIRGEHHGTYRFAKWWWPARGYTPAGVEAWNGIRALDYLETRPEVDRTRIGVTGRSGGGAYSWFIAALDERVKVAAPTAGITTLKNHILDGAIEGHCDCMFPVNTERWDFDRLAALVAPRALLIANTDKDDIFPLDGVMEIYNRTRALYRTLGAEKAIGLQIAEGPHKDTQPLNTGAFHWMNRFLKNADSMDLTDEPARKVFPPRELRVFTELPKDERVTTVDEFFVPAASVKKEPLTASEWPAQRDAWMKALREECFRAWPQTPLPRVAAKRAIFTAQGLLLTPVPVADEEPFEFELWLMHREDVKPEELELVVLNVLDDQGWEEFRAMAAAGFPAQFPGVKADAASFDEARKMLLGTKWAMAYFAPRGAGPTSFASHPEAKRTHMLRRFQLLGETLESGQVFDIRQAVDALRGVAGFQTKPLWLQSERAMAANTLYASLFIPEVKRLDLHALPPSHRGGPTYLNVLRHLDIPQAVALAAERSTVALYTADAAAWQWPQSVVTSLGWGEKRLQLRKPLDEPGATK